MAILNHQNIDQELMRAFLLRHIGLPYIWGGDDPVKGYDCSGFAIEVLQAFGRFPHGNDTTAQGLFDIFNKPMDKARLGVLCFYGQGENHVRHVGICLNSWQMIEAGGGGRTTSSAEVASVQNAYIRIRPIRYRRDFLALRDPFLV